MSHYKWDLLKGDVELLHRSFMRMVVGTNKATPIPILMRELDRRPIMLHWVQRIAHFYNRMNQCDQGDLVYQSLMDSKLMHETYKKGWYHQVSNMMYNLGCENTPHVGG